MREAIQTQGGLETDLPLVEVKTKPTSVPNSVPNVRLTTTRDLLGFYIYASSYIPYMLAAGNFIPLMVREYASATAINSNGTACSKVDHNCTVNFMWGRVEPSTLSFYINSIGVVIQTLTLIFFSALADRCLWRTRFLFFFTWLGGLSASSYLLFKDPNLYLPLALITALANASIGIATAFYYAYLPVLVRNHPKVQLAIQQASGLREDEAELKVALVRDQVFNQISATSMAVGLLSGSIILLIAALVGRSLPGGPYGQQLGASLAGLWWLIVGLVGWYNLPKLEGPPLLESCNFLNHSICMLWNSLKTIRRAWGIWLGLLSWFFISDGLTTALMITIFVGSGSDIGVTSSESVYLSALAPLAEAVGITVLIQLKNRFLGSSSSKGINLLLTTVCLGLTVWGILGLHTTVGIRSKLGYYVYFTSLVTVYACLQSFHRVLFGELVPPGREAEYFGLYLISSRGTGWIGATVAGLINQRTHVVRNGYYFVLALFALGLMAILPINMRRGYHEASKLAVTA